MCPLNLDPELADQSFIPVEHIYLSILGLSLLDYFWVWIKFEPGAT